MTGQKLTELEIEQKYTAKQLNDCINSISILDKKVDKLLKLFNELKLQSSKDDTELELRLTTIETQLEVNSQRTHLELTVISVVLMVFTLLINFLGV